jgi:hypothetical protein
MVVGQWAQKTVLKIKTPFDALVGILHTLNRIYQLLLDQSNVEGTSYGGMVTLVVGAPTTRINFTHDEHVNLPLNAMRFVIPRKPIARLLLAAEEGADCEYKVLGSKTNEEEDPSDLSTSLLLRGGIPSFDTKEHTTPGRRIRALNIRAIETVDANNIPLQEAKVRIEIQI